MKIVAVSIAIVAGFPILFSPSAGATQADDTTIRITGYEAGVTPFISNVNLTASNPSVLNSIQFTVTPKPGSVARPLLGTYANSYLVDRGFENQQTGDILLPVYGLYDGYSNVVALTYCFLDGSSKQANITIGTTSFNDPCGYKNPTFLQPRSSAALSYNYVLVKGACSDFSPAIVDTNGALRWVAQAVFRFEANVSYNPRWSPEIYSLSQYINEHGLEAQSVISVDWGLHNQLHALAPRKLRRRTHDDWPTFQMVENQGQEQQSAVLNQIFPEGKSFALTFAASKETFSETRRNLLAVLASHPELKWRLVKEFWYAGEKIYEVYEVDRPRRTEPRQVGSTRPVRQPVNRLVEISPPSGHPPAGEL